MRNDHDDLRAARADLHRARLDRFVARAWRAAAWVAVIVTGGAMTRALGLS